MSTPLPSPEKPARPPRMRKPAKGSNAYYWYSPRFWHGMLAGDWFRLLARHRFAISPTRWGLCFGATVFTLINSVLIRYQRLRHGGKIAAAKLEQPPIFIIGHWRSGTTLLHELMVLDERHTYPDTYECLSPNHFLSSGGFVRKLCGWAIPAKRPMDNVVTGWERPQEDEFALMNMGLPSPYLTMAFPGHEAEGTDYLDFRGVPPEEIERWKQGLLRFLQTLTVRDPRRIVLKSPPHTGRIKVLMELFPDARFVHIVRDPLELYSSTMKLWPTLWWYQSLQIASLERLEPYVFECLRRMYDAYWEQQALVDPGRLCEVRYERLAADPVEELRRVYEQLDLGDFERVLPRLTEYLEQVGDYQPNKHQYDEQTTRRVLEQWGDYAARYGYAPPEVGQAGGGD